MFLPSPLVDFIRTQALRERFYKWNSKPIIGFLQQVFSNHEFTDFYQNSIDLKRGGVFFFHSREFFFSFFQNLICQGRGC